MEPNTSERDARNAPLHARAFATFRPDPCATAAVDARYAVARGDRVVRDKGGKRQNLLRWGGLLLKGVADDDEEAVLDALAMPLARPDEVVCGGRYGAAYSFGGDALVTLEQLARETDATISGARKLAAAIPRYYSDHEWRNIEVPPRRPHSLAHAARRCFRMGEVGRVVSERRGAGEARGVLRPGGTVRAPFAGLALWPVAAPPRSLTNAGGSRRRVSGARGPRRRREPVEAENGRRPLKWSPRGRGRGGSAVPGPRAVAAAPRRRRGAS